MAAGCKKADRNRKSGQATLYKSQNREDVNAKRRAKRIAKAKAKKSARSTIERGTARAIRRIESGKTKPHHIASVMDRLGISASLVARTIPEMREAA